jgi:arginine decarboxylase
MALVPSKMFFTKGVGKHKNNLQSFEAALRAAGIAPYNLVKVSSILPPKCQILSKAKGVGFLAPGQILHVVMAEVRSNEPNRLLCAGLGLAIPKAKDEQFGYISEHHGFGMTQRKCSDLCEDMAASMLATTLGLDLDPDTDYDTRKEIYKTSNLIVNTRSVVQTAEGEKNGLWTTALAAAVFIY